MVQLEEPLYIFPMQGFCNKIYNNYLKIVVWDTNEGKKNVERGTSVTADASDVGAGGAIIPWGSVNMLQGRYLPISSRL